MSDDSGDDPSRGENPGDKADQPQPDATEAGLEALAEDAKKRKDLYKALRGIAAGPKATYAVGPALLGAKASAIFNATGITSEGGELGVIGRLEVALQRLFDEVGAEVIMTALHFTNSVTFELEPKIPQPRRTEIERLAGEHPDKRITQEDLPVVVPDTVIGLEAVARLLREPPERIAARARVLGVGTREELRKLADTLEQNDASIQFVSPLRTTAELDAAEAGRFARRLRTGASEDSVTMRVRGRLTRTDSEAKQFRVVLDRDRMPPQLDRRRRTIEGGYTRRANDQVRQGSLWDTSVIAKVRARMAVPPGGGKPRPTEFTFTDVRSAADA